jgi:xanthine dehydrogenase YagS FAD-binding subunit
MNPFAYERAADPAAAFEAFTGANGGARYVAGGTNLVDLMKLGVEAPGLLVDISRLELAAIEGHDDGSLRIGATARNTDVALDNAVRQRFPMLSQALLAGASGQLRNVATVGGNLLQRTRCPYFQDVTKPCNKRHPGSGCPARDGEHRNLAILGHSEACVATHPSDMAVALAALDASVIVVGATGERTLSLHELYRLPGNEPDRDTALEPGELIIAIEIPALLAARQSSYRKVRDRASFSFAVVSVAAALKVSDGAVAEVRLALGGLAHRPWRALTAERSLVGGPATRHAFAAAAHAELAAAQPLRDNRFKVTLARNLIVDALTGLS